MPTEAAKENQIEWNDVEGGDEIPRPGELLAGRFRVESVLGVGGMGIVVGCKHLHLNQRVALKILRKEATRTPEAVTRFIREARAAASISSDHVVRIMDVGTLRATRIEGAGGTVDIELPYMVMEMLSGTDLDRMLHARGPLPIDEAVGYVLQACAAVSAAHELGIVHRDLKPANLFVMQSQGDLPLLKVLDFGISKMTRPDAVEEGNGKLTMTGTIVGSPVYMSPEQVRGGEIDSRSDIWALGSILHEILTGRLPFEADVQSALYAMIIADAPPPLRSLRKEAPAGLEAVILKCLEKDPNRRFANVQELARALAPFATGPTRSSVQTLLGGPRQKSVAVRGAASAKAAHDGRSNRMILFAAVGGAVLISGALTIFIATRGGDEHPPAPATASAAPSSAPTVAKTAGAEEPPAAAPPKTAEAATAPTAPSSESSANPTALPTAAPSSESSSNTASAPVKSARPATTTKTAAGRPSGAPSSPPTGGATGVDPLDGRK